MALNDWGAPKLKVTIPAQAEALADFPVLVNLTTAGGTGDFDCSDVFDKLAPLPYNDQYWDKVVLALPMDGADNSTAFPDLKGKTVTRYGDAKISTAQSKFGGASAYFDGTGDYLACAAHADFGFGTGDFSIECWLYISGGQGTDRGITDFRASGGSDIGTFFISTSNKLAVWYGSLVGNTGAALSTGQWYHVSLTRQSGTTRCFLNGVLEWSSSASINFGTTRPLGIGGSVATGIVGSSPFSGYIDDLRITKGVARYTANFTPPAHSIAKTDPLRRPKNLAIEYGSTGQQCFVEVERWDAINKSAQLWVKVPTVSATASTELNLYYDAAKADNTSHVGEIGSVAAQQVWNSGYAAVYHLSQNPSLTVKDSTVNAKHGTPNGGMPSTALIDGPTGKATVFDGVNDYISVPDPINATTAITVEAVFNITAIGANVYGLVANLYSGSGAIEFPLAVDGSQGGKLNVKHFTGSSWEPDLLSTLAVPAGQFVFGAGSYDGANMRNYLNTAITSRARTGNLTTGTNAWRIGARWDAEGQGGWFPGSIRCIRLSKAVRSSAWLATARLSDFDQLIALSRADVSELEMTGEIATVFGVESTVGFLAGVQTLETLGNVEAVFEPGAVVRVVYYDRNRVLRDGLMVMHDTTYGTLVDASAWGLIPGASGSSFVADVPADLSIGTMDDYIPVTLNAPLTVNTPIDFISWQQVGNAAVDLTAPWRNCLVLYSRL